MKSQLFEKIRTITERDQLLEEIDLMAKSLYEEQGKAFESCLDSKIRAWVSDIVRKETKADYLPDVQKYLDALKDDLEKLKVLNLTLAFEPSDVTIDKFTSFVKRNIANDVILDFEYDPKILGGALIKWSGEYRDFSLRRLFEDEYESKKSEILKIMYSK